MSEATVPTVGSEKSVKKTNLEDVSNDPSDIKKDAAKSKANQKPKNRKKNVSTKKMNTAKSAAADAQVDDAEQKPKKNKSTRKKAVDLDTFMTLQDQIAANQKELLDSISATFQTTMNTQLKRADRRRRWNNILRDLIIVILVLGLGYAAHLLYNLGYRIEGTEIINTETAHPTNESTVSNEPVKDDAWYLANYSYLLDQVKIDLSADNVSAYYLYSDNHTLRDIKPEYLLNMAYRQVAREQANSAELADTGSSNGATMSVENGVVTLPTGTLKAEFTKLFGDNVKFYTSNFNAGCLNFTYQRSNDTFEAQNQTCVLNQHREIIEKIDRIYQEGEVMYVISHAGIYDKDEKSYYNFNDLFRPVAKDAKQEDFDRYKDQLNRYQYQFHKSGENFYFNKITKLD